MVFAVAASWFLGASLCWRRHLGGILAVGVAWVPLAGAGGVVPVWVPMGSGMVVRLGIVGRVLGCGGIGTGVVGGWRVWGMMGVGGIGAGVHAWGGSGGAGGAASGCVPGGGARGGRRGLSMRLARAVVSSSVYANTLVSSHCFVCIVNYWQLFRYHKACLLVSVGCALLQLGKFAECVVG